MSIDLVLGPRPEEPGPPISGPTAYPAEVTERLAADAAIIIARYPQPRSALLPLLHLVQSEDGYLTTAGIAFCANQLGLTDAEVAAVATFYSMYRRTPTGDYLIGVCTNTLCAIMGGDAILETLETELGIHAGDTTTDGTITLEHIEC
ncbi:NAD(P)H-dependent oxidoreductase subunit E, partial [Mycobacterium sp. shizuoka-1]|uniref:NAD(P)H-dependent oxidoreductase subunit E n=1 Tax=Mycobacterium sp. shizuoka-1 TaxID=2039281 RepID=UPI0018EDE8F8